MKSLLILASIIAVVPLPQGVGQPVKRVVQKKSAPTGSVTQGAKQDDESTKSVAIRGILAQITKIQQDYAEQVKAAEAQGNQNGDINRNIERYTLGLVIVGFIQALILAGTIWAVIHQANTSKNSERAWVLVERVGNPAEHWRSIPSYVPGIIFEFRVYGNTVAKITDGQFDLNWFPQKKGQPRPTPDLPEIPDYSRALRLPNVSKDGIPWAPGGTYQVHRICGLDQEKKEMLANGDIVFCGYGYLKYIDVFGKKRETRTCYIYHIQHGGVMKGPDGVVLNPDGFYLGGPAAYNKAT